MPGRNEAPLMSSGTAVVEKAGPTGGSLRRPDRDAAWPGPLQLLLLSTWCGLVAGPLEVGAIVLRKQVLDLNQLSWMSRHFVWLIPLIDLAIFLILGLVLSVVVGRADRRGGWLATRLLAAVTVLAPIWAVFPRIYGIAGVLLAVGLASRLVPMLERHSLGFGRLVRISFPVLAVVGPILGACVWGMDQLAVRREEAQPLPPSSPNVLLIVLDTVGADHLGLYGYERPTSPTLNGLAARGIRFDRAYASASWTLPSHASLFTGRWPHELSAGWFTPLDQTYPTLAEFLASRGFATAGFIANAWYCAADSGLARGFTTYRDYRFPRLTASSTASLVDRLMEGVDALEHFLEDWLDFDLLRPVADRLWWVFKSNRKAAAEVDREFLAWLSGRRQPERPFFAFLNYYDAHAPYEMPERSIHRFGTRPRNRRELAAIVDWMQLIREKPSPSQIDFARNAYDDCVADLDEQIGRLVDELERRGVLERTWVIVTGDHGESFGEHPHEFWHGTSLHQAQRRVPLVIVPPPGGPSPRVVGEPVSLRDLPATIVDVLGWRADSPFPGLPLSRFWTGPPPKDPQADISDPVLSELVPLGAFIRDPAQWVKNPRWPMAALTEGDWTYIRREGQDREELFRMRGDAQEQHNLAGDPAMQATLERMRAAMDRVTAGPLTPQRFNP
jgi:arylsulfatase A-like enzyme